MLIPRPLIQPFAELVLGHTKGGNQIPDLVHIQLSYLALVGLGDF